MSQDNFSVWRKIMNCKMRARANQDTESIATHLSKHPEYSRDPHCFRILCRCRTGIKSLSARSSTRSWKKVPPTIKRMIHTKPPNGRLETRYKDFNQRGTLLSDCPDWGYLNNRSMQLPWLGVFKYLYQCHCTGWEYLNI